MNHENGNSYHIVLNHLQNTTDTYIGIREIVSTETAVIVKYEDDTYLKFSPETLEFDEGYLLEMEEVRSPFTTKIFKGGVTVTFGRPKEGSNATLVARMPIDAIERMNYFSLQGQEDRLGHRRLVLFWNRVRSHLIFKSFWYRDHGQHDIATRLLWQADALYNHFINFVRKYNHV